MPCESVNQTRLCASTAVPTPLLALDVQRGGMPGCPGAFPLDAISAALLAQRLLPCVARARALLAVDGLRLSAPCQRQNPPTNALASSPLRQPGGSSFRLWTLPPPSTTSSGRRAAIRRVTTSATYLRHFFLPYRSSPRLPT